MLKIKKCGIFEVPRAIINTEQIILEYYRPIQI